jgi:hypothetical protein
MALRQYKIKYKDGRTQEVEASSSKTTTEFIYFEKDGEWALQVAASSVESVGNADIPEARKPAPKMGAV